MKSLNCISDKSFLTIILSSSMSTIHSLNVSCHPTISNIFTKFYSLACYHHSPLSLNLNQWWILVLLFFSISSSSSHTSPDSVKRKKKKCESERRRERRERRERRKRKKRRKREKREKRTSAYQNRQKREKQTNKDNSSSRRTSEQVLCTDHDTFLEYH